jgi:hypothetical protein
MNCFVSDSEASPVPTPPPTATQVWLEGSKNTLPEQIATCSILVAACPATSHLGTAKPAESLQVFTTAAEPTEAVITVRVTEESIRQELEKFRDLLRQAKQLDAFSFFFWFISLVRCFFRE